MNRKVNFSEGFHGPFWSISFYRRAGSSSSVSAWLILSLFIILISWMSGTRLWTASESWMNEMVKNIDQGLVLSFKEGKLKVEGITQPFYSTQESSGEPLFIIDTSGTITDMPPTGEVVLITSDEFMMRSNNAEERRMPFEAFKDLSGFELDHPRLVELVPMLARSVGLFSMIMAFFWLMLVKAGKWLLFCLIYVIIRAAFGLQGLTNSFATICVYTFIPFSVLSAAMIHYGITLPMHTLTMNLLNLAAAVMLSNQSGTVKPGVTADPWEGELETMNNNISTSGTEEESGDKTL